MVGSRAEQTSLPSRQLRSASAAHSRPQTLPACSAHLPSSHLNEAEPVVEPVPSLAVRVYPLAAPVTEPRQALLPTFQSRFPAEQFDFAFVHSGELAPPPEPSQRQR